MVNKIEATEYLLPGIQRKFVWGQDQIEKLFDSLICEYPINAYPFWSLLDSTTASKYPFYDFIRNYDDYSKKENERASVDGKEFMAHGWINKDYTAHILAK